MTENAFQQSLVTPAVVGGWGKKVKRVMTPAPTKLKSKRGEWTVETMGLALGMI
jgi:hypothetical protein